MIIHLFMTDKNTTIELWKPSSSLGESNHQKQKCVAWCFVAFLIARALMATLDLRTFTLDVTNKLHPNRKVWQKTSCKNGQTLTFSHLSQEIFDNANYILADKEEKKVLSGANKVIWFRGLGWPLHLDDDANRPIDPPAMSWRGRSGGKCWAMNLNLNSNSTVPYAPSPKLSHGTCCSSTTASAGYNSLSAPLATRRGYQSVQRSPVRSCVHQRNMENIFVIFCKFESLQKWFLMASLVTLMSFTTTSAASSFSWN